ILGVIREDVGTGRDYKQAATDAFKRAAVRFGIAHELYAYEQNWVQVESDGKYAKPIEDPAEAYARKTERAERGERGERAQRPEGAVASRPTLSTEEVGDIEVAVGPRAIDEPSCPKCGGRMWDNRLS